MSAVKSSVKFSSPITVFVAGGSMREQDAELSPTSRCVQGKARDAEARNKAKVHTLVRQRNRRETDCKGRNLLCHDVGERISCMYTGISGPG